MAYTTAAKVRAMLPTLLIDTDDLGDSFSGTNLTLNYPAYDVPTLLKDGETATFTFVRPDSITLNSAADGERYIATVYYGIANTEIDAIIAAADRVILDSFSKYDLPAVGYLEDWSSMLSAARYLRMYASATDENIAKASELEKIVMKAIESYKDNTAVDNNYIVIKVNR